jgi:hypothetical protein
MISGSIKRSGFRVQGLWFRVQGSSSRVRFMVRARVRVRIRIRVRVRDTGYGLRVMGYG